LFNWDTLFTQSAIGAFMLFVWYSDRKLLLQILSGLSKEIQELKTCIESNMKGGEK